MRHKPKYKVTQFQPLFIKLGTVKAVAARTGASYAWVRHNLLQAGVKLPGRGEHSVALARSAPVAMDKVVRMKGNGMSPKQVVETISRAVAQAAFANAQYQPPPMTRQEQFDSIQKGVNAGIKKLGVGFHA